MSKFMISAILVIAFVAFAQADKIYGPGLSEPAAYGPYNDRERRDLRDGRLFGGGGPSRNGGRPPYGGGGGGRPPYGGGGGGRPPYGGGGGRFTSGGSGRPPYGGGRGGRPYRRGGL